MIGRWATVQEAATLWSVHPRTIVRWIRLGVIDGVKMGPRVYRVWVDTRATKPPDADDSISIRERG
jgi:excisionase family DNA binding protein